MNLDTFMGRMEGIVISARRDLVGRDGTVECSAKVENDVINCRLKLPSLECSVSLSAQEMRLQYTGATATLDRQFDRIYESPRPRKDLCVQLERMREQLNGDATATVSVQLPFGDYQLAYDLIAATILNPPVQKPRLG